MTPFADELEKLSAGEQLASMFGKRLLSRGAAGLVTTVPGAAVGGAVLGGVRGALSADDGTPTWSRAARGAMTGGVLGAGAGVIGRTAKDYSLLHAGAGAGQIAAGTAGVMGRSVKNFGKRQLHGFTGAFKDNPAGMGLNSSGLAAKKMHLEKLRASDAIRRGAEPASAAADLAEKLKGLHHEGLDGDRALRAGITNLPGVAKGLVTKPISTVKELGHAAFGGSPVGAAVGVGLPLALGANDLRKGDESAEGGPTVGRKLKMIGTNVAGGVLTGGLPMVSNVVAGGLLDRAVAHRPRPAPPIMPELSVDSPR